VGIDTYGWIHKGYFLKKAFLRVLSH